MVTLLHTNITKIIISRKKSQILQKCLSGTVEVAVADRVKIRRDFDLDIKESGLQT